MLLSDDYTFINESHFKESHIIKSCRLVSMALEACEPTDGGESVPETAGQILSWGCTKCTGQFRGRGGGDQPSQSLGVHKTRP